MSFTSWQFLAFLAVVLTAYYLAERSAHAQVGILIAASLTFYAWDDPWLLVLLLTVALIAAGASRMLESTTARASQRKLITTAAVTACLGLLCYFKYAGLLVDTVLGRSGGGALGEYLRHVVLPIGISFYVFHAVSLVIDVERGDFRPPAGRSGAAHLAHTALYMTFFPQLVSGPITKAKQFMPQIGGKRLQDIEVERAFRFLLLGYFLKLVIADNLAVQTQAMAYPHFLGLSSYHLLGLMLGYSCQIFADFFGYSLIAMGLAELFGYQLPENFNRPYIATSFSEFWRRWHMSLSAWLRDYLYRPLGGSRHGALRTYRNLFLVMFLGGLWHGASWNFALWGTLHGLALAVERPFLESTLYTSRNWALRLVRGLVVFAVVTVGWLFFKFAEASEALAFLGALASNWQLDTNMSILSAIYVLSVPVLIYHLLPGLVPSGLGERASAWSYSAMLLLIATNSGVPGAFIYFRF